MGQRKRARGFVLLTVCSSLAVVPALSVTTAGVGHRHHAGAGAGDTHAAEAPALLAVDSAPAPVAGEGDPAPPLATRPAPAPPVLPGAAPVPGPNRVGQATWLNIRAGTCANNDAPMGAVITVTNTAGVAVTCKVVSRGPFAVGRIVDLAKATFAHIGQVSSGVVTVTVSW